MGLLDWLTDIGGSMPQTMLPPNLRAPPMPPVQDMDIPPSALRGPGVPPVNMQQLRQVMGPQPPAVPPQPTQFPPVQDMVGAMPPPPMMPETEMDQPAGPAMPPQQARFNPARSALPPSLPPTSLAPPGPQGPADLPPNAMPTSGGPPPMIVSRGQESTDGMSFLGRALGMNARDDSTLRGSLAGGMKAVSENYRKPGLAAFAGGAAGTLEGADKAEKTDYDKRIKALSGAIAAKKAGDDASYKTNWLRYQMDKSDKKLGLEREKMARGGKSWNKPESQRYYDAMRAVNGDETVKALAKAYGEAITPEDKTAALDKLEKKKAEIRAEAFSMMGITPDRMKFLRENMPGSEKNPHDLKGLGRDDFANYVQPGDYFVNPKDGKVYRAKPKASTNASPASPAPLTSPSFDDDVEIDVTDDDFE